jgi:acyl dehydratase
MNEAFHKTSMWTLTLDDLVRYAWVSGDINPIHFDQAAAKELGLPGTIVHGLFTHAKLTAEISHAVRELNLRSITESQTKFAGMMTCPGEYKIEVLKPANENVITARALNLEGALCVEVRATLAP